MNSFFCSYGPPQSTVPKAAEMEVGSCLQDEVLQTPVTPVSAEALTSLHNLRVAVIRVGAWEWRGKYSRRLEGSGEGWLS